MKKRNHRNRRTSKKSSLPELVCLFSQSQKAKIVRRGSSGWSLGLKPEPVHRTEKQNEREARACASTKSRNATPTNYRCENPWEIGSVARAGRDADPLTPRKAATVARLCATAQSWNMYIEKLSEKSLPKENQKTRRKADLNTEMEDMRDEEG